jgi:hypothetical protein
MCPFIWFSQIHKVFKLCWNINNDETSLSWTCCSKVCNFHIHNTHTHTTYLRNSCRSDFKLTKKRLHLPLLNFSNFNHNKVDVIKSLIYLVLDISQNATQYMPNNISLNFFFLTYNTKFHYVNTFESFHCNVVTTSMCSSWCDGYKHNHVSHLYYATIQSATICNWLFLCDVHIPLIYI